MNPLKKRIAALIEATGPMSVSDYMALCLFDPEHGYYTTREPFGQKGDFTTAPEISQMFGELCALWLYQAWQAAGGPERPVVAEIGPGRGTLMKDMLRTLRKVDARFVESARIVLIETSPRLTAIQKETLKESGVSPQWCERVTDLPEGHLLIVGNELFDAIPIRQYIRTGKGWRERMVGLDDKGELAFLAGPGSVEESLVPAAARNAPLGTIVEFAPARTALMDEIAMRLSTGGSGLFIDYGYETAGPGDTLQAMRAHAYADPLAAPGEADLTAHVDFSALARMAHHRGLEASTMPQGDFLLALGLLERAGHLGANKSQAEQETIRAAVQRLAAPEAMGTLFKVLGVARAGALPEPFTHRLHA